ncbi:MAG: rod shape-determining protein MreD [Pseudonocardiales bacterium]|nr:rod shape-determining protein MreD [Pseudonocardiales bacterium]
MTASRGAAGLATLITAMLLQATLIGPLFVPLPASLPLVVILSIALLTGPSTGITLGFAGGLLVDLGSQHPVGVLAFTWLGAGLAAGVLGGMVVPTEAGGRSRAPSTLRRDRWTDRRRADLFAARDRSRRGSDRSATRALPPVNRRRPQALLVGLLGAAAAAATAVVLAVVDQGADPIGPTLARCVPAGILDAMLALAVLPVLGMALRSGSLRAPAAIDSHREAHHNVTAWSSVRVEAR